MSKNLSALGKGRKEKKGHQREKAVRSKPKNQSFISLFVFISVRRRKCFFYYRFSDSICDYGETNFSFHHVYLFYIIYFVFFLSILRCVEINEYQRNKKKHDLAYMIKCSEKCRETGQPCSYYSILRPFVHSLFHSSFYSSLSCIISPTFFVA